MRNVRITVRRRACYTDLMEEYENPIEHACDLEEGQVFVAQGWQRPEGLCDSAWETISPFVMTLAHGGEDIYDGWMKNRKAAMISCNDGFRPVSFLLEALPDYRYLLFDLDGTLVQSEFGIIDSVIYALGKFGIRDADREDLKKFIGPALFESFQKYYRFSPEEADRAVMYYREAYEREGIFHAPVYDGAEEMLRELLAMGKDLFVVTAKPQEMAEVVLRHTGLLQYFRAVIGPGRKERHTDKASLIRKALCRISEGTLPQGGAAAAKEEEIQNGVTGQYAIADYTAERHMTAKSLSDYTAERHMTAKSLSDIAGLTLMLGDRHYDIEGAQEAGVDSVGVLYGYGSRQELTKAGATYLAQTPGEITGLIRQAAVSGQEAAGKS